MGIFIRHLYEDDRDARVLVNGVQLLDYTLPRSTGATARAEPQTIHVRQAALLPGDEYYLTDRICGFRLNEGLFKVDFDANNLFTITSWMPISLMK